MTLNGGSVRDILRVLGVSSATVIDVLKKTSRMANVTGKQYGGGYSSTAIRLDMLCKIYTNHIGKYF